LALQAPSRFSSLALGGIPAEAAADGGTPSWEFATGASLVVLFFGSHCPEVLKWDWYIFTYLDLPKGAKWMVKGAIKQPLRVQTPPLGGCW